MTSDIDGGGKLPGKTLYAGRRRAMTRKSGFSVHKDTTGGQMRRFGVKIIKLESGQRLDVTFLISGHDKGDLLGVGMWFWHTDGIEISTVGAPKKKTLTDFGDDSWNKFGSIWRPVSADPIEVIFSFIAKSEGAVSVYQPNGGRIQHNHLENAREALMRNMYDFAPEALFCDNKLTATIEIGGSSNSIEGEHELLLKSCNRCGRYLPINTGNERNQLSFTNHCVAAHRRPCKHSTFSSLRNVEDETDVIKLDYGYQLECRFCKKFEVNAAHNPQRSSGQMKEDGARRRAFELLLADLYQGTPQLLYRHKHKSELADDVWKAFEKQCFNCGCKLESARAMHLDHTRPLAFLWPLDGTATALCGSCNSQKRDRVPSEFYLKHGQLEKLSEITAISVADLNNPAPNENAIAFLLKRIDWFFDDFLMRPEMTKERDGKITGELVVKALQRVLASSPKYRSFDLQAEYEKRRTKS